MGFSRQDGRPKWLQAAAALTGALLAGVSVGGLGEIYIRLFPPRELSVAADKGPFIADRELGVAYRSWDAFRDDNPRLRDYLPMDADDSRPLWAFFGNSFVQAPGMLADTARERLVDHCIFNLGRNEHLCVRLAQIRLLLDNGLKAERIVVALMPLDVASLGLDALDDLTVGPGGALTVQPRWPRGGFGRFCALSALARTAWLRAGRGHADPDFKAASLNAGVGPRLALDLDRLFAGLAVAAHEHRTPVTVLLIPTFEQIVRGAPCGFQDALTPMLRRHGLDVCDPRDAFRNQADKPALFIPDKHFSDVGNRILLDAVTRHLAAAGDAVP